MSDTRMARQAKKGFLTAGAWLLGFVWLSAVFAGMEIGFSSSRYPRGIGWSLLAIAAVALVLTADHWIKAFPGIMGIATFNGLIMISSGHVTGNPAVLIPRSTAILMTLALAVGSALSLTFRNRNLTVLDRIALLALAASVVWGAIGEHSALRALAIGVGCLFLAWIYDRMLRNQHS